MNIIKKIKLALKIRKPAGNLIQEVSKVKSGWKTSEFWMVILSNLLAVVGALNGVIDEKTATICVTVLNAIYALVRTMAKIPVTVGTTTTTVPQPEGVSTTTTLAVKTPAA